MGTKFNFQRKDERNYEKALHDMGKIFYHKFTHPWCIEEIGNFLFSPFFFEERKNTKTMHQFTKEVIQEKEKTFNDEEAAEEHSVYKGKKRRAMLDLLLSAKRNESAIDDDGIQEEVVTFMFEGHDTTAAALSFMLMLLANNENVQVKGNYNV